MRCAVILIAPDQPGLAERASTILRAAGGNVETSRMVRLGSEFSMALLVHFQEEVDLGELRAQLEAAGFTALLRETGTVEQGEAIRYAVRAIGLDHPGIVAEISAAIRACGGNILAAETELVHAPYSGAPSFSFVAEVGLPGAEQARQLRQRLEALAEQEHLDIETEPLRVR